MARVRRRGERGLLASLRPVTRLKNGAVACFSFTAKHLYGHISRFSFLFIRTCAGVVVADPCGLPELDAPIPCEISTAAGVQHNDVPVRAREGEKSLRQNVGPGLLPCDRSDWSDPHGAWSR